MTASAKPRFWHVACLAASLVAVGVLTLRPNFGPRTFAPIHCILCGEVGSTTFLLNVLLFMPLGASFRLLGFSFGATALLTLTGTLGIELAQLSIITGRHAAAGDIVANSLGGLAGWLGLGMLPLLIRPRGLTAGFPALAVAALLVGGAGLTGWAQHSAPTGLPWFTQLEPDLPGSPPLRANVASGTLNGDAVRSEGLPPLVGVPARRSLVSDTVKLQIVLHFTPAPTGLAPAFRLVDGHGAELAMIGRQSSDLLFAVRTRAAALRLRQPMMRIRGALRCGSCAEGDSATAVIRAERHGSMWTLSTSGSIDTSATASVSPNAGWIFLAPWTPHLDRRGMFPTVLWLAFLGLLLGYWSARLVEPAAGGFTPVSAALLPAATITLSQFLMPELGGIPLAPVGEILTLVAATTVGAAAAVATRAPAK